MTYSQARNDRAVELRESRPWLVDNDAEFLSEYERVVLLDKYLSQVYKTQSVKAGTYDIKTTLACTAHLLYF